MKTIFEGSERARNCHVSLTKYRNLNNISHYHNDHELIYVNEGKAELTVNEAIYRLSVGECALIRSNDIHYIQSDESSVVSVLKAEAEYFGNIFTSKRLLSPVLKSDGAIASALLEIERELSDGREYADVISDSIAARLFAEIMRSERSSEIEERRSGRAEINDLYSGIKNKIFTEYQTITFDDAARYMHFSRPYFSKLFQSIFGMTFTNYLNTVRVFFAIEMLKAGNMNVTEISFACGFNTIRNFNRVFKRLTGYSPNKLPRDYVFIHNLNDTSGLDPTLNCTEVILTEKSISEN